jgi:glycosyltransferase involved in cell wall biosynthesis
MSTHKPRISIGLPVYNGERYLRQALDAILSQTFADFELIISDNASTDSTPDICKSYAAKDARVRYFRNSSNIGISRNFNRVFELSSGGEYFKWCAHDDLIAPDVVQKCVEYLDQNPEIVLCYPKSIDIDEDGNAFRYYTYKLRTDSPKASERFYDLMWYEHPCFQLFAVVRTSALRKTPLHEHYPSADRVLIARLGFLGPFHQLPDYLHYNRDYPGTSVRAYRSRHNLMVLHDPSKAGKIVFPYWVHFWGYLKAIADAPISIKERLQCYLYMIPYVRRWRKKMIGDLILAIKEPLRPLYYKLRPQSGQ